MTETEDRRAEEGAECCATTPKRCCCQNNTPSRKGGMGFFGRCLTYMGWAFFMAIGVPVGLITLLIVYAFVSGVEGDDDGSNIGLSSRSKKGPKVGVIELTGEILGSSDFAELVKRAVEDEEIKAVVVRIDSPGGSVGASEEIHRLIKNADQKKPFICSLGNLAASGGLYTAVACRKILGNKGTLSGSIGVIMMMPELNEIMGRFGVKMNVIKSGRFKDTGSPFRQPTEADQQILQELVNKAHEQFVEIVAASRGLDPVKVKEFADGRIIIGEEALKLGIIDQIGGPLDAAKIALSEAQVSGEPQLVPIKKAEGFKKLLEDLELSSLIQVPKQFSGPRLMYMMEWGGY